MLGAAVPTDSNDLTIYRSPFIMPTFYCEVASIDKKYREAFGLPPQPEFNPTYAELTSEFPFCERFVSAAIFYLSSFLVVDVNEELADTMYERYCDSICSIIKSIPTKSERTSNVY